MIRVFEELNRFVGNLTKDEKKRIDIYRNLAITKERTEAKQKEIKQVQEMILEKENELKELEEKRMAKSANYVETIDKKAIWEVLRRKEYYRGFLGTIKQSIITSAKDLGIDEKTVLDGIQAVEKRVVGDDAVYKGLLADFHAAEPKENVGTEETAPDPQEVDETQTGDEPGGKDKKEDPKSLSSSENKEEVPPELVKMEIARHKAAVMGFIDDMKSAKSQVVNYRRFIKNLSTNEKKYYKAYLILALVGIAIAIGLYVLLNFYEDSLSKSWQNVLAWFVEIKGHVITAITVALPFLSKATDIANKYMSKAKQVFGFLDSTKEDLELLKQNATKELDAAIKRKQDDIDAAHDKISQLSLEMSELKQQKEDLETEKEEIEAGEQLTAYLEKRMEETDYKKHLGLISTVREDLEKLTGYLHQRGEHTRVVMKMNRRQNEESENYNPLGIEKVDTIDRIVLYIDDLDRCPPDKVVDVLQAIHLMLHFPLFVVVVGVDVRWASKALLQRYKGMIGSEYRNENTDKGEFIFGKEVSAYDYLEKIFQIPFRLSALDNNEKLTYIRKLVKNDEKLDPQYEELQKKKTKTRGMVPTRNTADFVATAAHLEKGYLNYNDRLLLQVLSPILNENPRAIKRFVNICRMMKSHEKYGVRHDSFKLKGFQSFKKMILALAMVTGLPEFVRLWIEYNKSDEGKLKTDLSFEDFIKKEADKLLFKEEKKEEVGANNHQAKEELHRMIDFMNPPVPTKELNESADSFKDREEFHKDTMSAFEDLKEYTFDEFKEYLEIASKFSFRFYRY